jgi:hypothetical protein
MRPSSQPIARSGGQLLSSLATQGSTNKRIPVQAFPGIKQDPISKITNAKRNGGVAQVVMQMPSKHETLNSTPNTQY